MVADLKQILEALRDHQRGAGTLALQQRVGGHRRAHADPLDGFGRKAFFGKWRSGDFLQDAADALAGCVRVVLRIFREQFDHSEARLPRNLGVDISEGSASVNRETEGVFGHVVNRDNRVDLPQRHRDTEDTEHILLIIFLGVL